MGDFQDNSDLSLNESHIIEGRNALIEALNSDRQIDKLFVLDSSENKSLSPLVARCREKGADIIKCDRKRLDRMSKTGAHQGVIAYLSACEYKTVADILAAAKASGRASLVVVCDHISDPQNLGAIIRSAEVSGAHGVIIPKRRSPGLTPSVFKASAGAAMYLPIARVANIVAAIGELKDAGLWIYGAEAHGDTLLYNADFKAPAAIVLGSEGAGLSRLVKENCDFIISIPMLGKVSSLNVSAATAVLLYEALRQRL